MMPRWSLLLVLIPVLVAACGGGPAAEPAASAAPPAPAAAPAAKEPLLPAVTGEVIGFPGAPVPGLSATHVVTERGWLGKDGDVVFEAVIRWNATLELACGILRRGPDGKINTILMQGQALPGTGGGVVIHPRLPLETSGDLLVIPSDVGGGTIDHGLFAVHRGGGSPELLAGLVGGVFVGAKALADGTVVAEAATATGREIVVVKPGEAPAAVCRGCEPGFSVERDRIVVRKDGAALAVELDGVASTLLRTGDPAPGAAGSVTGIRAATVNDSGDFLVHATTDDPARPDVLVRIADRVEVIAACGAPAPGTTGTFGTLHPARGGTPDVVFAATIDGDPVRSAALFCAPAGESAELVAASGDRALDLDADLDLMAEAAVTDGSRAAVGARVLGEEGVFLVGEGGLVRVVTTNAPVAALDGVTVERLLYPPREAIDVDAEGRTLVHVGLREERRPEATLGALILGR